MNVATSKISSAVGPYNLPTVLGPQGWILPATAPAYTAVSITWLCTVFTGAEKEGKCSWKGTIFLAYRHTCTTRLFFSLFTNMCSFCKSIY